MRKLVAWATNKHDVDPRFPRFAVLFTDYSPESEQPLKTELRVASCAQNLDALADDWLAANIKRGWVAASSFRRPEEDAAENLALRRPVLCPIELWARAEWIPRSRWVRKGPQPMMRLGRPAAFGDHGPWLSVGSLHFVLNDPAVVVFLRRTMSDTRPHIAPLRSLSSGSERGELDRGDDEQLMALAAGGARSAFAVLVSR